MVGFRIAGTGRHVPGRPYTNHDLARVMETSDEWIFQRSGIRQRHFCPEGIGVSDLALPAAQQALAKAGCAPEDVDYIVFASMTPDHVWPGSGALLGAKLGCAGTPSVDIRVQCAAFVTAIQLIDGLFRGGMVKRVLFVGADAHAGFMPWRDWDILEGTTDRKPSEEDWARATRHRGLAMLFGDGAGAVLFEATDEPGMGLLGIDVHADGRFNDKLYLPAGFRTRPFVSKRTIDEELFIPRMEGREVFKHAVTKLPKSVHVALGRADVEIGQIDWFVAHQANARINEAIRESLKVAAEKVPSNIERYGNTSAGTIPILLDEMRENGRHRTGQLLCFLALGAGLHWGAAVARF